MYENLTADELRNIDEDTYLVVEVHEDEYWMQGEGRVSYVKEYDSGKVTGGVTGLRGHPGRLHVPADARSGLTFDGAANGSSGLRVDRVTARDK